MGIAEQMGIRPYTGKSASETPKRSKAGWPPPTPSAAELGKPQLREMDRQWATLEKRVTVLEEAMRLMQVSVTLKRDSVTPSRDVTEPESRERDAKRDAVEAAMIEAGKRMGQPMTAAERQKRRRERRKAASSEL